MTNQNSLVAGVKKVDKTKPRRHNRVKSDIPCGFCGERFRTYRLRYRHAKDCKVAKGRKRHGQPATEYS